MIATGLVEVEPSRWNALLGELRCADAYLLAGYVNAACVLDPGEPVFLHLEEDGGDVVLAAIVREAPGAARDVTTPYGYGGPVAVGPDPPAQRFYELYEEWCWRRDIVASFFRYHPLFANRRYAGPDFHLEELGRTVGWPLRGDGDLLEGMHPTHRNKVRKALKAGAGVELAGASAALGEFTTLYGETMQRLGADSFYLFPPAYWERLSAGLGERLVRFDARIGSELVASALCLATPPWLHYHLSASSERGRRIGAGNLLLLEAARWGRAQGFEILHLGGGLGGREDSLFAFKAHFAPGGLLPMHLGKAVHDAPRYLELTGEPAVRFDGYFPAYRRPRPV
jgi:hypothetical protein